MRYIIITLALLMASCAGVQPEGPTPAEAATEPGPDRILCDTFAEAGIMMVGGVEACLRDFPKDDPIMLAYIADCRGLSPKPFAMCVLGHQLMRETSRTTVK